FFFSSRRRHTRSKRDWSSDVCSSDLIEKMSAEPESPLASLYEQQMNITAEDVFHHAEKGDKIANEVIKYTTEVLAHVFANLGVKIGRASCRERVYRGVDRSGVRM